jgi:hypothetical protein
MGLESAKNSSQMAIPVTGGEDFAGLGCSSLAGRDERSKDPSLVKVCMDQELGMPLDSQDERVDLAFNAFNDAVVRCGVNDEPST